MSVRRFLAVFYPAAEYLQTTRITKVGEHHFKTEGRVLQAPGWLAVYGRAAGEDEKTLPAITPDERVAVAAVESQANQTKPPPRYTEATLLSAMEGAGKFVEDDELREAMQEKGLGTPATRAAIIEGLINEKYMLREGRELIPTAKAFQLMTLLRGLGVEELSKPELTGEWEYKLAQMEHGKLSRDAFMREIGEMTKHIVKKAKEYDRDTIPGDLRMIRAEFADPVQVLRVGGGRNVRTQVLCELDDCRSQAARPGMHQTAVPRAKRERAVREVVRGHPLEHGEADQEEEPPRPRVRAADHHSLRPSHPHPPLAAMLVLTQLAVGLLALERFAHRVLSRHGLAAAVGDLAEVPAEERVQQPRAEAAHEDAARGVGIGGDGEEIVLDGASEYEQKCQRVDFAAFSAQHEVVVAGHAQDPRPARRLVRGWGCRLQILGAIRFPRQGGTIEHQFRQRHRTHVFGVGIRAEHAIQVLINGGLEADRVKATGYADTKPIAANDTEKGRSKNRRIEIVITQWTESGGPGGETKAPVGKKLQGFSTQTVTHH